MIKPIIGGIRTDIISPIIAGGRFVYQGGLGGFATFDTGAAITSTSILMKFNFYVISHNQTIRGLVQNGEGFTSASIFRNVTARLSNTDDLQIQFRNSGGTNTTITVPSVPTGQWLSVEAIVTDGLQRVVTSWASEVTEFNSFAPAYAGTQIRILDIDTADSVGVQIENVIYDADNTALVNAKCNEGSGLVSVNAGTLADGTLSSEEIHRKRL